MILTSGDTGDSGGYQTQRSLRFRSSASAYTSRAFSSGDARTLTRSYLIKRGSLGANGIASAYTDVNNQTGFTFNSNDQLQVYQLNASTTVLNKVTTRVFRDPAAWVHLLFVFDTYNAINEDKVRIYVNGVRETSFSTNTNFTAASTTYFNDPSALELTGRAGASFGALYITEAFGVDGKALSPSVFCEYDTTVPTYWRPKSPAQVRAAVAVGGGARNGFGVNGGYWPFSDPTSLTTLMYDRSQSDTDTTGNNWTANNISLTAGSTYDSMLDVPLGGGGSERGNYATLNPLVSVTTPSTYSNGNLTATTASSGFSITSASIAMPSGSWYCEVKFSSLAIGAFVGIRNAAEVTTSYIGGTSGSYGYYSTSGVKYTAGTPTAYGSAYTTAHTIGIAFNATAGTLEFYRDNVSQGVAFTSIPATDYVFAISDEGTGSVALDVNFGQRPFTYTPPTGVKALHTGNLPTPTGAALEPRKHFDVALRSGTSGSVAISGFQFKPDLIWPKARNVAFNNYLYDSVRGVQRELIPNSTVAETTQTRTLLSFDSSGYTWGDDGDSRGVNMTGNLYVDWLWKAGGAAVTNTAGSITSQVSANTAAGFSIVTYTGTSANAAVGHGLGVAPKMVIVKGRGNSVSWAIYHQNLIGTPGQVWIPFDTSATLTASTVWNNTAPTSSLFSIGTASNTNVNTVQFVAYCFAEIPGYSKIGSYVGNGSSDGPFVFCGFRPRYVMVKRTDVTGNWVVHDTARDAYNSPGNALYPNLSDLEGSGVRFLDFLSNGFKLRANTGDENASGGTYIFMALSEAPFKYANAR
jgi:hypothetical protein